MVKVIQLFKNPQSLIEKAASGNRRAQKKIYDQYSPKMLSVCRQYIRDLQHAEDVMLKGFLKAFNHLDNFRNSGSFEGWLRRIMVNESISFLRQNRNFQLQDEEMEDSYYVESSVKAEMDVAYIQEMIDALPEGYKAVFILYAVEGYKHSEIAEMLDITEGTSKSQLFKARKMLQAQIKKSNETDYGTS